MALACVY